MIVFDDGFKSNHYEIFDFMKELGIKYNIFLVSCMSGVDPRMLSWEEARKMHESGSVVFGGHTYTHPNMTHLADSEMRHEIIDANDLFKTHDCFSSSEFAAISAFGISEPGKECEAVEKDVIAFDGAKPINPSGGLIGCGHPVGASGARMFVDLYKQVTGKATSYQVKGAKNGMMLNIGVSAMTNYVFIVGEDT